MTKTLIRRDAICQQSRAVIRRHFIIQIERKNQTKPWLPAGNFHYMRWNLVFHQIAYSSPRKKCISTSLYFLADFFIFLPEYRIVNLDTKCHRTKKKWVSNEIETHFKLFTSSFKKFFFYQTHANEFVLENWRWICLIRKHFACEICRICELDCNFDGFLTARYVEVRFFFGFFIVAQWPVFCVIYGTSCVIFEKMHWLVKTVIVIAMCW